MSQRQAIDAQLVRLMGILRRHVRVEDHKLSDDALTRIVFNRYAKERDQPLIDPNE